MIKAESLKALLKAIHVPDEVIAKVDGEEEHDISLPEGVKVFDATGYATLEKNLKDQGKSTHITAGKEIAIKELKEKSGLDFEGKDPAVFLEKYKENVLNEAKVSPGEVKAKWEADKTALQKTIDDLNNKVSELEGEKSQMSRDARILQNLPKDRNTNIPDRVHLSTIKGMLAVKGEDGREYFELNGQALKDDKMDYLPFDKALSKVYESNAWMKGSGTPPPPGGQGFDDMGGTGGAFNSLDDVEKGMRAKGIEPGSTEGNKFLQDAISKNPKLVE